MRFGFVLALEVCSLSSTADRHAGYRVSTVGGIRRRGSGGKGTEKDPLTGRDGILLGFKGDADPSLRGFPGE